DDRLRLAIRPRAPEPPPEPGADDAAPVARGELRQPRDPGRAVLAVDDQQVEALAALALAGEALDVGLRLVEARVRPPREPPRHHGVAREVEEGGRVLAGRRAQRQRGTMQRDAGTA